MDDKEKALKFKDMWLSAFEVTNSKKPSVEAVRMSYQMLKNYNLEDIAQAIFFHLQNPETGKFAPTPSDILKFINGDQNVKANEAWSLVERSIKSLGASPDIIFKDQAIMQCIHNLGGWSKACNQETDKDLHFYSIEFKAMYKAMQNHKFKQAPKFLKGTENNSRRQYKMKLEQPRLIGFQNESEKKVALAKFYESQKELGYQNNSSISTIGEQTEHYFLRKWKAES